ncbi:TPA: 5-formaminoimidazole-4-carboxamide-1-(beta)-D-ribofuranosyl 5'-monophosphate synthetase, partial [Candidatus Acetothermia bacterium]|nr:5-formaminoimidazole-4-carboxamide-1-(beta)-D-ribofuranosyl 5'-monophosphate synthetase [Candidatus Acetothermia bacterium]
MINKKIAADYDTEKISIATICSHSSLQIIHGARQEGFRTIGICTKEREKLYSSFPLAS